MITIVPYAGLANRLRAVFSAIQLARESNSSLQLVWFHSDDLGANFSDLFWLPGNIKVIEVNATQQASRLATVLLGLRSDRRFYRIIRKARYNLIYKDTFDKLGAPIFPPSINKSLDLTKLNQKQVLIETCYAFYPYRLEVMDKLKPINALQEEINRFSRTWNPRPIGVHIRRTDHTMAQSFAPINIFIQAIEDKLLNDPETSFFLATDCEDTSRLCISLFGDRILKRPCKYNRDSKKGIQDSLIDLYLLSRCIEIYGSPGSSFSKMASEIGRIPIKTIQL